MRLAIRGLVLSLRFQLDGLALGLFLLLAGALLLFALLPSLPVSGEVLNTFAEVDEFRPVEGWLGIDQLGHGALAEAVLVHAVDQQLQQYGKLTVGGGCIDAGSKTPRADEGRRVRNGQALSYVYFKNQHGRRSVGTVFTRDEARHLAAAVAKLPELLA
jgi:hypothetical protein